MSHAFSVTLCVFAAMGEPSGAAPPADAPSRAAQANLLSHFPSSIWTCGRLLDGALVCAGDSDEGQERVYLCHRDVRRWEQLPLELGHPPRYSNLRPVGGDAKRLFFLAKDEKEVFPLGSHLLSVNADGKITALRKVPTDAAAFADADLGAAGVQFSVLLTTDGGATWRHGGRLEKESETVSALLWVTASRLLVGGDRGTLMLMERQEDAKLRKVWASGPDRQAVVSLLADGDHVWVRGPGAGLYRFALADGRADATVISRIAVEGFAVCHGWLLVWDWGRLEIEPDGEARTSPSSLSVWGRKRNGQGYEHHASMKLPSAREDESPALTGVLPDGAARCVAVSLKGRAYAVDLEKKTFAPTDLAVSPLPAKQSPHPDTFATPEQVATMFRLGAKLSEEEARAVYAEMQRQRDLTHRQKIEWAIQELQRIIDAKKAGKPEK